MKHAALLPLFTILAGLLLPRDGGKVAETCTVSGQVVRTDSAEPLKSARVVLIENARSEKPRTYKAFSDGTGHFSITGITPGRYRFSASHNGFVPQQFRPEGATGPGALLELSPGQKLEKVLFRLTPAAVITGKITDEDGQPLAGVEMEALMDARHAEAVADEGDDEAPETAMLAAKLEMVPIGMAVTNDLGEYRMYGLPAGDYYVAAVDSGMPELTDHSLRGGMISWGAGNEPMTDHPPMYYPGVFARNEAQKVHVAAGSTVRADLTLRSEKTLKVVGRVLGENGQPAAGIYVILDSRDMDIMFSAMRNMATTDAQGRFTIEGVVPGSYVLQATKTEGQTQLSAEMPMEISGQPPPDVTLKLERGISLAGKVVLAEVPASREIDFGSLHVWLSPTTGNISGFGAAEVKKDGTFKMADLRRSTYSVHLTGLPNGWYLKSASLGSTDVLAHGIVASGTTSSLQLTISSRAAEVSGTVMMDDKPVPGASVQILPEHENPFRRDLRRKAVTDQHGHFILESVVPGAYQIRVVAGSDPEMGDDDQRSHNARASERVEVGESDKKTVLLFLKQQQ